MGAATKKDVCSANMQYGSPLPGFFSQAGWTDNKITGFFKAFFWIIDKCINATLTAKIMSLSLMVKEARFVFADP